MMRRLWRSDDTGASLVIALLFVTVVAVVVAGVLSLADASMRTTMAMRDQAEGSSDADAAAKIAINALRQGTYSIDTGGNCFSGGSTLTLSNFSTQAPGPASSAAVTCAPDTTNSAIDPNVAISSSNKPGSAILTLGTSAAEKGIDLTMSGQRTLLVHGGIFSNSTINVGLGTLQSNTKVAARGDCTGTIVSTPAKTCNLGSAVDSRGDDPNYPAPTTTPVAQSVPACPGDNKVVPFEPGLYSGTPTVNALNNLTKNNGCRNSTFWFKPGTYYFDFPANKPWVIDTGYVVGGTPTSPLLGSPAPGIPGACMSPVPPNPFPVGGWTKPPADAGVQFVFGGETQIQLESAQMEICGTYSANRPPIAVYGLKTAVGVVPAQGPQTAAVNGRAMISTDQSPNSKFYIQGTTYAPNGYMDISLNNDTGQVFRYGVILRRLELSTTGSADLSNPVIEVPDDTPVFGVRTVVYLIVYICPGVGACSSSTGRLRLRVKVALIDATGTAVAGARAVTVLSWSVQR